MARRKGMMKGKGRGYKNVIGKDPMVHSQSARGIKQPQKVPRIPKIKRMSWSNPKLSKLAQEQLKRIDTEQKLLMERYPKANSYERSGISSRYNSLENQRGKIIQSGLSGKEQGQLKREMKDFKQVDYETDLFYRGKTLEGKSKVFGNKNVRIKMSKAGTGFRINPYEIDSVQVKR